MVSSPGSSQVSVTESWVAVVASRPLGLAGGSVGCAPATAAVAALVSVSSLSASSVKLTCTVMALLSSAIGQGVG